MFNRALGHGKWGKRMWGWRGCLSNERKGNQTGGHRQDTLQNKEAVAAQEIQVE